MSYEQLYLHMKALKKERDELLKFIADQCWTIDDLGGQSDARCHPQYEEIEHVV